MSFITAIGTAVPSHRFAQSTLATFMQMVMQPDYEQARKLQTIFRSSGIDYRHSVLEDYGKQSNFSFYSDNLSDPLPTTEKRITIYRQQALGLSLKAIERCFQNRPGFSTDSITHLITVSCTGMYAPGLDVDLVKALNLHPHVERTGINFMGCYAAFSAIKIAHAICQSKKAVVLIVCTELCSLHFQKEPTEDNLLANALFADGAAAVIMESTPQAGWNLTPIAFHNSLSFSEEQHMVWSIGNFGFEMKLSAYVPEVIRSGIRKLTLHMLEALHKTLYDVRHLAIHPGGKKILEVIETEIGVTREQNEPAYHVLRNFGNMSSPTVLFVLDYIIQHLQPGDDQTDVLGFAFGPGLTLESMLLTVIKK